MRDRFTTAVTCAQSMTFLLFFLLAQGCVEIIDPETRELKFQDRTFTDLPSVTLVRRVIPQISTKIVGVLKRWEMEQVSSSKFGDANQIADLSCVINGIRRNFPEVDIVPTEIFWGRVAEQSESVELTELFTSPASSRWQELQMDVLIVAFHQIIDVERFYGEIIFIGAYHDIDRETAAFLAIDLWNKKVFHASEAVFEDNDGVGHYLFFPYAVETIASSDVCSMVGEAAGAAISNASLKSAPRVVVVAARDNPYHAAQAINREEERENERARLEKTEVKV